MNLNRLKEIREDKDMSQDKIAKLLNISRSYYTNIENKIRIITLDKLIIFVNYFNISFDYALGLTNQKQYNEYKIDSKIDYEFIGENIKKLRISNNKTQLDLANAINVCRVCISRYESGNEKLSTNNLCKIARYFNVSLDKIIRRIK